MDGRPSERPSSHVVALTALALACFAGNSLLCRAALVARHIDATSFTVIRLVSGALVLSVLARGRSVDTSATERARWGSALALFAYAAPFSFAYLRLGAAIGALVLFGCVQATMIGVGIARGERPSTLAWVGIALALGGLALLTVPGKTAPNPLGAVMMAIAGAAWGVYSLRGRTSKDDPVVATSASFSRASLLALVLAGVVLPWSWSTGSFMPPSLRGVLLAVVSGAFASGVGYSLWYAALRHLTATRAAVLQLLVPIVAAVLAVLFLGETASARLVGAGLAIVGGVATATLARRAGPPARS